jgi:hypothetical protein
MLRKRIYPTQPTPPPPPPQPSTVVYLEILEINKQQ